MGTKHKMVEISGSIDDEESRERAFGLVFHDGAVVTFACEQGDVRLEFESCIQDGNERGCFLFRGVSFVEQSSDGGVQVLDARTDLVDLMRFSGDNELFGIRWEGQAVIVVVDWIRFQPRSDMVVSYRFDPACFCARFWSSP